MNEQSGLALEMYLVCTYDFVAYLPVLACPVWSMTTCNKQRCRALFLMYACLPFLNSLTYAILVGVCEFYSCINIIPSLISCHGVFIFHLYFVHFSLEERLIDEIYESFHTFVFSILATFSNIFFESLRIPCHKTNWP